MSVSQFPNADKIDVMNLIDLVEQLIDMPSDPQTAKALEDATHLMFAAYICALVEAILQSRQLRNLGGPFDPATEQQLKSLIDSCR